MGKLRTEEARQKNRDRVRARRHVIQEIIADYKRRPCTDCCVEYPPHVMQFDHVRGKKEYTISRIQRGTISMKRILLEIAKCDVVCANCHAERTYSRFVAGRTGFQPVS